METQQRPLDMDLYSRQLGAYGLDTMTKLASMRILIIGLSGPGIEIAKDLVLAGPNKVTLLDDSRPSLNDLCSNFAVCESDLTAGRSRAEIAAAAIRPLNPYVEVAVAEDPVGDALIAAHDCVVLSNALKGDMTIVNSKCRDSNKAFVAVNVFGMACSIFVDFGPAFTVSDVDGEEAGQTLVDGITVVSADKLLVHCVEEKRQPFQDGDFVKFQEIEGAVELNQLPPVAVSHCQKYSFEIAVNTMMMGAYQRGGVVVQHKRGRQLTFRDYESACRLPVPEGELCLLTPDLGKFGRSEQLHVATQAVLAYAHKHNMLPAYGDNDALNEIVALAEELHKGFFSSSSQETQGAIQIESVDSAVVENTARFARFQTAPMSAFVGGIAAQEVIKLTGKYTPLHQWFYFDAFECLAKEEVPVEDGAYFEQRAMWGSAMQIKLEGLRSFVVGAGALGCEYLKNLTLMGCATGPNGMLTVSDMDRIEVSNLNRQFLFRKEHVGSSKSAVAAAAVKTMRPALHIRSSETRVGLETEGEWTDEFWNNQDIVVNALDNVPSRLYVDNKCVWHMKPLLESGTLGVKANVQVIVPPLTETYGDSRDPPETAIPLCTLRHFPNQIEHTIEWARDLFAGTFTEAAQEANQLIANPDACFHSLRAGQSDSQRLEQLTSMAILLDIVAAENQLQACVAASVEMFQKHFNHGPAQLLYNFPLEYVTSSGAPFWSGAKRAPHPLHLDVADPLHLMFIVATANLYGSVAGLPPFRDVEAIAERARGIKLQGFRPRQVQIGVDDADIANEGAADDGIACAALEGRLREQLAKYPSIKFNPIEFEKDDDTNFHIDFMAAAGNLRARCYQIPEAERWKAKLMAGKIIPAVATATAMVTGLASLELIKLLSYERRSVEEFRNAFISLADCTFVLSEPMPPKRNVDIDYDPVIGGPVRAKPPGFTTWDRKQWDMRGKTVRDLVERLEAEFETEVTILSAGVACLYNKFDKKHADRLHQPLLHLLSQTRGDQTQPVPANVVVEACCTDGDGVDVVIPTGLGARDVQRGSFTLARNI